MDNWKKGIISINGVYFYPGFTFEDFKNTKYYTNQNGVEIINIKEIYSKGKYDFLMDLFFRNGILYMISLLCVNIQFEMVDEPERKKLHDKILKQFGILPNESFSWGKILSEYDNRGNVSNIEFVYF